MTAAGIGDEIDPDAHDLFYLGGGQDRDQLLCARDLVEIKRDALHAAAARGAVILGVCGGYQLLGHSYVLGDEEIAGIGLLDARDGARGRAAPDRQRRDRGRAAGRRPGPRVLAGFENHGGRTRLGPGATAARPRPARVTATTAPRASRACATAPSSAPTCTARCCRRTPGSPTGWCRPRSASTTPLAALDDALEDAAHAGARRAAGAAGWRSAPGRAEAARAARGVAQLVRPRPARAARRRPRTSWAIRSPAAISNARLAVGVEQQHLQLAAVARVDQAGRVDERDAVPRREARARQDQPAWPGGQLDRDARPDLRALPGADRAAPRARRGRGRRRRRARGPAGRRAGSSRRTGSVTPARAPLPVTAKRAKRSATVRGHARAHAHAVGRVVALEVAGDARAARPGGRPRRTAAAARPAASGARTRPRSARAGRRAPRPSRAETSTRVGMRRRSSARRSASIRSALLSTSSRGFSPAPISSSTSSTAASISSSSSSSARRVDDVQDQVGEPRLLERRAERVDELMRQLADEADGVGEQVRAAVEAHRARRRVERVEEPVLHADVGAGERVQQRRLAGVRVAGERDLREARRARARRASRRASP